MYNNSQTNSYKNYKYQNMLSKHFKILIVLTITQFILISGFNFANLQVYSDSTTINQTTNYQFYFQRTLDNTGATTNYANQPVPAGSNVTITFPSTYNTSVGYTCQPGSSGTTNACIINGQNITITGLYNSSNITTTLNINISGVLNPSPAFITDFFYGYIGNDVAVPMSPGSVVQLTNDQFTNCAITFSPAYLNKTGNMVITLTPKNLIFSGGYIVINFPVYNYWFEDIAYQPFGITSTMSCTNLSSNVSPALTCTGTASAKLLTVNSLFTSNNINQFSFSVANLLSPPNLDFVAIDQFTITSYYQGYMIDQCKAWVTGLIPNTLPSIVATTTPSIITVNTANVQIRLTITFADTFKANLNTIQIIFPASFILTYTSISSTFSSSAVPSYNSSANTLTISFTGSKTYYTNSSVYVGFNSWTVPPSTNTTSPIIFNIQRYNMTTQTGSITLQPIASTNITLVVTPAVLTVSQNTSYSISFKLGDPISSSGIIMITFPSSITAAFTSSNCANIVGTGLNANPICTLNNSNSLVLTNLNSSNSVIAAQTMIITINGIINPPTTQPSSTFGIITYYTSALDIVANTVSGSVTAMPGILNSSLASITSSSYTVYATGVNYTFQFHNLNIMPIGSIIQIGIPISIGVSNTLSCFGSINSATLTNQNCISTVNTQFTYINITNLFSSASAAANSTITIVFNSMITNPSSTAPVTTFSIMLLASSGYIINQLLSGLSLTMTTPADFTTVSVTHSSNINNVINNVTVSLSQPSALSSGSILTVYFPIQIIVQSNLMCFDLTSVAVACTLNSNTVTATLLSNASNTGFGLIITNVLNAPSLKPSSKFGFSTTTSTGYYYSMNLQTSATITNTQIPSFTSLTGVFSNPFLASSQNLTINFVPTNPINGWVLISLAPSFTLNTLACLSWVGSCTTNLNILNISGTFNTTNNQIVITGFTSPNSIPSDYTSIKSFDSSGYAMNFNSNSILFTLNCTLPCKTCSPTVTSCTSCYTSSLIIIYNYYFSNVNNCLNSCPTSTYTDNVAFLCISCSNNCFTCNSSTYCLSCLSTSTYPYLNQTQTTSSCLSICPVGTYPNTTQTSNYFCSVCVSPCSKCMNTTYCTACIQGYYFNTSGSNCLLSCPANFTITNTTNMSCDPCANVCYSCSINTTNCIGCSSTTALYLGTCVTSCPSPLVINAGQCTTCTNPCLTCVNTATNCTSCNTSTSTPFLLNNLCLSSCPSYYYNTSISGSCYSCQNLNINCINCINATTCSLNCDSGYVYMNGNCINTVPSGYVNISGIAQPCIGGCATCSVLQSNCTACLSNLYFYQNSCISACPTGYTVISLVCMLCLSPCLTCQTSVSNCLSCNPSVNPSVYLSGTSCVTNCPSTTYGNQLTNICTNCTNPCLTCTSSVLCNSCVASYSLYGTNCLTACPSGYISINSICLLCTSPCSTCSVSQSLCTSCLTNLTNLLYLTGSQCVLSTNCPAGTYANSSNYQCTACVAPCSTCTDSLTCSSCIVSYYLYGTSCFTSCPSGYVGINSICIICNSPCSTCTNTQNNCTSCLSILSPNVFLTGNICVVASNCPSTTYGNTTNNICTNCISPCVTCTSITSCSSCIMNYSLLGVSCLLTCPLYYVSINSICIVCSSPCSTCSMIASNCTSCLSNISPSVYLTGNSCVIAINCPSSTYANNTNNMCDSCLSTCSTCTSLVICTSCNIGYTLQGNNCLTNCNSGYASINSVCYLCNSPCATCTGTQNNCTSCLSLSPAVYLTGNNCVISASCPTGTYGNNSNNQCTSCNTPCLTCSSSSNCLSCIANYSLYISNCVNTCPSGYVSISSQCLSCISPCSTCSITQTNCSTCLTSLNPSVFLTVYNTCVIAANCPPKTYGNTANYKCVDCISPCNTCTSATSCLNCIAGYFFKGSNNSCVNPCPSGETPVNNICLACVSPCLTCVNAVTICLSCITTITPTVYLSGSSCTTICPDYYYGDITTQICLSCVKPCLTCSNQVNCLSCVIGYSLFNSNCISNCLSGYVSIASQCLSCISPCLTCSNSQTNCTSCVTSVNPIVYLTTYSTCVIATSCPPQTFANTANYQCTICISPCLTCSSATSCLSCLGGYNFTNYSCLSSCPVNQIPVNSICTTCISPCLTCFNSLTSCVTCDPTISPTVYLSGNFCTTSCPSYYYPDLTSHTCLGCVSPCLNCLTQLKCSSCIVGYILYNNNCLNACPSGYVAISSECLPCISPCATCLITQTSCSSCLTSLNPSVYLTIYNTCVISTNCPPQTYANTANYQCSTCVAPCFTCSSATTCLSCLNGYTFTNNYCSSSCPSTQIPVNSVCTQCTSPCLTCFNLLSSCVTCDPTLIPPVYLYGSYCTISCPSYYYPDISSHQCLSCLSPCLTCSSQTACLSCVVGSNLYNSACITSCPSGFTAIYSVCVACNYPCASCSTTQNTCTSCVNSLSSPLFLTSYNTCVTYTGCPSQTYSNSSTFVCATCVPPCLTCNSQVSCNSCIPGSSLFNTNCLSICPSQYISINSICTICASPCLTCSVNTTNCLSCNSTISPTVYLSGNICSTSCPSYYYGDIISNTCLNCISPCLTCSNQANCLTCITNYSLLNSECLIACPPGYVSISSQCLACLSPCLTCTFTQNTCNSCITTISPSLYLTSFNTCVIALNCPPQTYSNTANYKCDSCISPCLTCTSSSSCLTCVTGSYFVPSSNSCISMCPIGEISINFTCTACTSPCLTCSQSITSCLSCDPNINPPVYLSGSLCKTTCPTYYYGDNIGHQCLGCISPCSTCQSQSICLTCVTNYSLSNSACVTTCPSGFVSISQQCLACLTPCLTCISGQTVCSSCITTLNPSMFHTVYNTCVIAANCPPQTYANTANYQCVACSSPCLTCLSASICLSCVIGYDYHSSTNSCLSNCPSGQTAISSICVVCASPCLTCAVAITSCLTCDPNLTPTVYLSGTVCTTNCPSYYYGDTSSHTCISCVSPCLTCSSASSCLSCIPTYNLLNFGCSTTCPLGYVAMSSQCLVCLSPCSTCNNTQSSCTSCITTLNPPVFLTAYNTCVTASSCPPQTYGNSANNKCDSCISPCLTCNSLSSCLTCVTGSYFQPLNNSCINQCPVGQTIMQQICTACTSPCLTCSQSITSCLSCDPNINPPVYLSGSLCTTTCPTYYYGDNIGHQCLGCISPCSTCQSQSICLTCVTNYSLSNSACVTTCPSGFVSISQQCLACLTPCLTCISGQTVCSSCITTLNPSMFHTVYNTCVIAANCPPQTYANTANYQCVACSSPCLTCLSASICLSCVIGYDYHSSTNSCLSNCPSGQTAISSICVVCASPCLTCAAAITSCLTCDPNLTPTVYLSGTVCTTNCPSYYYGDTSSHTCISCVSPCLTCSSASSCLSCIPTYNLLNFGCSTTCPLGYVAMSSQCLVCLSPCSTCNNTQSSCTSCITTLNPPVFLTAYNTCVTASSCPSQTYGNQANFQCVSCITPCLTCSSASACLSCVTGYNYKPSNNTCLNSCPSGEILVLQTCLPCSSPCLTCAITVTSCLSCDPTLNPKLFHIGTSCSQTCPATTYPNYKNGTCDDCISPCSTCNSSSICISCASGYNLYGTYCYINCPSGLIGVNQICVSCSSPCLTCVNSTYMCLSCVIGFYLVSTSYTCVVTCPPNLFMNYTSQTCVGCTNPCITCTNYPNNCTSCSGGLYLFNSLNTSSNSNYTCISNCPTSYFLLGSYCMMCPQGCITCTSSSICQTCLPVYYMYKNMCYTNCPSTITVIINNTCLNCVDSNCKNCTTINYCILCTTPYLILNGTCYSSCPNPYSSNLTSCYLGSAYQNLNSSLSSDSGLFPMPFTITSTGIIILCFVFKFRYPQTFLAGAVYSLTSIPEVLVNIYFTYLYYEFARENFRDLFVLFALSILGLLYVMNLVNLFAINALYLKDEQFQEWMQSTNSKVTYTVSLIIALFTNHKMINLIFSKLFHFRIFKAKLINVHKLFYLHFMWFMSLIYTISGITLASYHLYKYPIVKDQLYLESFDFIIVLILNAIFGFLNTHKEDDFFDEIDNTMIFRKGQSELEQLNATVTSTANIMVQKQKSGKGLYKNAEGESDAIQSNLEVVEEIEESNSFVNDNKLRDELKKKLDKLKKNDDSRVEQHDSIMGEKDKKKKEKSGIYFHQNNQEDDLKSINSNQQYIKKSKKPNQEEVDNNIFSKLQSAFPNKSEIIDDQSQNNQIKNDSKITKKSKKINAKQMQSQEIRVISENDQIISHVSNQKLIEEQKQDGKLSQLKLTDSKILNKNKEHDVIEFSNQSQVSNKNSEGSQKSLMKSKVITSQVKNNSSKILQKSKLQQKEGLNQSKHQYSKISIQSRVKKGDPRSQQKLLEQQRNQQEFKNSEGEEDSQNIQDEDNTQLIKSQLMKSQNFSKSKIFEKNKEDLQKSLIKDKGNKKELQKSILKQDSKVISNKSLRYEQPEKEKSSASKEELNKMSVLNKSIKQEAQKIIVKGDENKSFAIKDQNALLAENIIETDLLNKSIDKKSIEESANKDIVEAPLIIIKSSQINNNDLITPQKLQGNIKNSKEEEQSKTDAMNQSTTAKKLDTNLKDYFTKISEKSENSQKGSEPQFYTPNRSNLKQQYTGNEKAFLRDPSKIIQEAQELKQYKDDSVIIEQPKKKNNAEYQRKLKEKESELAHLRKKIREKEAQKMEQEINNRIKTRRQGQQLNDSDLLSYSQGEVDQNRKKIQQLSMSIVQKKEDDEQSMMEQIQKSLQKYNIFDSVKKKDKDSLLKNEQKLPNPHMGEIHRQLSRQSLKFEQNRINFKDQPSDIKSKTSSQDSSGISKIKLENVGKKKQKSSYIHDPNLIIESSEDQDDIFKQGTTLEQKRKHQTIQQRKLRFQHQLDSSFRESEQQIVRAPTFVKTYGNLSKEIQQNTNNEMLNRTSSNSSQTLFKIKDVKKLTGKDSPDMSFGKKLGEGINKTVNKNKLPKIGKQEKQDQYLSESEPDTEKDNFFNQKLNIDSYSTLQNKTKIIPESYQGSMQFKVLGPRVSKSPLLSTPPILGKKQALVQKKPPLNTNERILPTTLRPSTGSSNVGQSYNQMNMTGGLSKGRKLENSLEKQQNNSRSKSKDNKPNRGNVHIPRIQTINTKQKSLSRELSDLGFSELKNSRSIQKIASMRNEQNILQRPNEQLSQFYNSSIKKSRSKSKEKKKPYQPTDKDRELERIYLGRSKSKDKL